MAHSKSWEVDIEEKRRFLKTLPDKEAFETAIKARRTSEFAQLQARPDLDVPWFVQYPLPLL